MQLALKSWKGLLNHRTHELKIQEQLRPGCRVSDADVVSIHSSVRLPSANKSKKSVFYEPAQFFLMSILMINPNGACKICNQITGTISQSLFSNERN
jgi:hypothetical protein